MNARRIGPAIACELAFWALIVAPFLFAYVRKVNAPASAIGAHLLVLTAAWFALLCFRTLIWTLIPGQRLARLCGAGVVAVFACLLASYYLLVLGGLGSWGRVISWSLIATYGRQSPQLMEAMGVAPALFVGIAACVALLMWVIVDRLVLRRDWTAVTRAFPRAIRIMAALGGIFAVGVLGYDFAMMPFVLEKEPISLTFFPEHATTRLQNHLMYDRTPFDRAEAQARTAYHVNPAATRRNVILIVGDALRADHMGLYGYGRPTTPNLDRMANDRVILQVPHTLSVCAESSCGLLAISEARYLHQFASRPFGLQDVLRLHGYSIEMVLSGDHTNFYGLRDAYGKVDHYFDGADAKGYYVNDDRLVIDHLSQLPAWDGRPVMMQIHLMSTHVLGARQQAWRRFTPEKRYTLHTADFETTPLEDRAGVVNYYDNGVL